METSKLLSYKKHFMNLHLYDLKELQTFSDPGYKYI